MTKRVAIIGGGPAGLAAAKAVYEYGMDPVIIEATPQIGGLWRREGGSVYPQMKTNLSRWNYFSDHEWPKGTADFPTAANVIDYLESYAKDFDLLEDVRLDARVARMERLGDKWRIEMRAKNGDLSYDRFDSVISAAGIFTKGMIPKALQGNNVIHSSEYRREADWGGKCVGVVGSSFSGIEIATDLAAQGVPVKLFMSRPMWILARHLGSVPLDLALGKRRPPVFDPIETNTKTANFFKGAFGNPGDWHEALRVSEDGSPLYVVISDHFPGFVREGAIEPIPSRAVARVEKGIITQDGKHHAVDAIICATGSETGLSFLPKSIRQQIQYDPHDKFMPFIADQSVRPVDVPDFYLVGQYRGPYFPVMELQARWAASEIVHNRPPATQADVVDQIAIRNQRPRPQFPYRYADAADRLAKILGLFPGATGDTELDRAIAEGPVTSAQFRLVGENAKPVQARAAVLSAWQRMSA